MRWNILFITLLVFEAFIFHLCEILVPFLLIITQRTNLCACTWRRTAYAIKGLLLNSSAWCHALWPSFSLILMFGKPWNHTASSPLTVLLVLFYYYHQAFFTHSFLNFCSNLLIDDVGSILFFHGFSSSFHLYFSLIFLCSHSFFLSHIQLKYPH